MTDAEKIKRLVEIIRMLIWEGDFVVSAADSTASRMLKELGESEGTYEEYVEWLKRRG